MGCGSGRNLFYFLKNGYEVFGVDSDSNAIKSVQALSANLTPDHPLNHFIVSSAEQLPFEDASFDVVICSAVLHFAKDDTHFDAMIHSMFRVLKPGGYFFARLASNIGIENRVMPLGSNRYALPDGTERYLVNEEILTKYTAELGELYEPLKTTNVQNLRCMTTWCVQKNESN